jgi:hypothetical protein
MGGLGSDCVRKEVKEMNSKLWWSYSIESSGLPIPLLNAQQGRLSGEVEHQEDGHCIVTNKGQHADEFPLPTKIPNAKCDLSIAKGDCFFHKIHT